MIRGEHSFIRNTEPDDAEHLYALYDRERPRAALLDKRAEPMMPSRDDLRELLAKPETAQGNLLTVEDLTGEIAGFCSLRGMHHEALFGEIALMFFGDSAYDGELADEACDFLEQRAFVQYRLRKVMAQCLDGEEALRAFLVRRGYASEGKRREVLHARGQWHDLEALSLFSPSVFIREGK